MRLKVALSLFACLMGTSLLGSCSGDAARPETVNTTFPTTPSMTPTSPSAREEMGLAAQAVVDFWTELDRLALDPDRPIVLLRRVASGQARDQWFEVTTHMRAARIHQEGSVVVITAVPRYDDKADLYRVATCIDVSGVRMTDPEGRSIIPAGREPRMEYTFVVSRVRGTFRVIDDSSVGIPC